MQVHVGKPDSGNGNSRQFSRQHSAETDSGHSSSSNHSSAHVTVERVDGQVQSILVKCNCGEQFSLQCHYDSDGEHQNVR